MSLRNGQSQVCVHAFTVYEQLLEHLHSTLPDEESWPVFVRGFQIEPFSTIPNDLRDWQLVDFKTPRDDENTRFV